MNFKSHCGRPNHLPSISAAY